MPKARKNVQPWQHKETLRWALTKADGSPTIAAGVLGCSQAAVCKWRERHDVSHQSTSRKAVKPWRDEGTLRWAYVDQGRTVRETASLLGVSFQCVRDNLEKCGIDRRSPGGQRELLRPTPWRDREVLHRLYFNEERSLREVADELGCDARAVQYWMEKYGMEARASDRDKAPWQFRDKYTLSRLYFDEVMSINEIAEVFNTSGRAVLYWLDKHGFSTRPQGVDGKSHPSWQGGPVAVECSWCRDEKKVRQSRLDSTDNFLCSDECMSAWRSEKYSGEGHPRWRGGPAQYGKGWNTQKRRDVRSRDEYKCQVCGKTQQEHRKESGERLHVHHIKPARTFENAERRNSMENLITVCNSCHQRVEKMSPLFPEVKGAAAD